MCRVHARFPGVSQLCDISLRETSALGCLWPKSLEAKKISRRARRFPGFPGAAIWFRLAKCLTWRYFILLMERVVGSRARYLVRSVVHCSRVLGTFRPPAQALALREILVPKWPFQDHGMPLFVHPRQMRHGRKADKNLSQSCVHPWRQRLTVWVTRRQASITSLQRAFGQPEARRKRRGPIVILEPYL